MAAGFDRRTFVIGAGAAAGAAAISATFPAGAVQAALPAGASVYSPLPRAVRVADTRTSDSLPYQRLGPDRIRIVLAGQYDIPDDAVAVVATVAAVNRSEPNYVSVFPSTNDVPFVSNLNLSPGEVNANLVTTKVGDGGAIDVYSLVPCDVVVDVSGYYTPVSGPVAAGRYQGLNQAQRVLDTRPDYVGDAAVAVVDVGAAGVPQGASSVVLNLTATETTAPGFCTVFPYSDPEPPFTSSLNWSAAGATRASAVIAPIGPERWVKVYTYTAAKLIVDVTGYFTGPGHPESTEGTFVALDPVRIMDTRRADQIDPLTPGGVLWPGWVREATIPGRAGSDAASVLINLTATQTRAAGFLTVGPARVPLPGTSNVNWTTAGATVPNHAITRVTAGHGLQVYTPFGSAIVADMAGYYVGAPAGAQTGAPVNPPPPPAGVPWVLRIPGLLDGIGVLDGDSDRVTDSGYAWHWQGTGFVGETANIGIFAHRSDHGGPFRHIQYLEPGHQWYIDTGDGRRYIYEMTRRDLTDSRVDNILNATRFEAAPSCSLIACTVGYDRTKSNYPDIWAPTSTRYRIVVTGRLVAWHTLW